MFVYICSAYGGRQENYEKAVEYCKMAAREGNILLASHVMLHGIISEEAGREKGLEAGRNLITLCDQVWVFGIRTSGMKEEIAFARQLGIPILYKCEYKHTEERKRSCEHD